MLQWGLLLTISTVNKALTENFQQARQAVEANSSKKLTDEEISRIEEAASNNWDKFYGIHQV